MSTPKKPGKAQQLLENQLILCKHMETLARLLVEAGRGSWLVGQEGKQAENIADDLEALRFNMEQELNGDAQTSGN